MLYEYQGPVLRFGKCIDYIKKYTTAKSSKQARNNITFRYKQEHNLIASAHLCLPGKITKVD